MKSLLALSAVALLSLGVAGCGGSSKGTDSTPQAYPDAASGSAAGTTASNTTPTASSAMTTGQRAKDSNDLDDDPNSDDDNPIVDYGHAASAPENEAITAVVKRYYAAAAAGDGAKACSMLVSTVAEAVPEEYGEASGPAYLRGKTCAVVMSKLFKRHHRQLADNIATFEVTKVRAEEGKGLVVLRFATTPEPRKIAVRREGSVWKIKELLDSGMP